MLRRFFPRLNKKAFTLIEILLAISILAIATVGIGSMIMSTQNNTAKMFNESELQQQLVEVQDAVHNEILSTVNGIRYWTKKEESSTAKFNMVYEDDEDSYEKLVAFYNVDPTDYTLTKTYYKYNSKDKTLKTATTEPEKVELDKVKDIDKDIDAIVQEIENGGLWTTVAVNLETFSIDFSNYDQSKIITYSMEVKQDDVSYPAEDTIYVRNDIKVNSDLVIDEYHTVLLKKPVISNTTFVYDGQEHRPTIGYNERFVKVTETSDLVKRDAGTYHITFVLKDKSGMRWEDGTTDDVVLTWTIQPKKINVVWGDTVWVYDGQAHSTTCRIASGELIGSDTCNVELVNNSVGPDVGSVECTAKLSNPNYQIKVGNKKTLMITASTLTISSSGYDGVYDGNQHSITVACEQSGSTITYSTSRNGTYSSTKPAYVDVGTYTVYYKVTMPNYEDIIGSEIVNIKKANGRLVLSATNGEISYPNTGKFDVIENVSNGTLSVKSSNNNIATVSINNNTVTITPGLSSGTATITVTAEETPNYHAVSVTYSITVKSGALNVVANGYTGTYDGKAHGITVTCDGATITYSASRDGTYDTNNIMHTNAGTYTVYYKVEKTGYTTVTGSERVVINKANGLVTLDKTSGSLAYPATTTVSITKNASGGTLSVSSSNSSAASATLSGTTVTVKSGTTASTVTITVTSDATDNYNAASATYTVVVSNGTLSNVVATGWEGTYDGKAHGITVSCSTAGATITYSTSQNGTYNSTNPTYINASPSAYVVYYKVERPGYATVTGSKTVIINKAPGSLKLSSYSSGQLIYPATATFKVTENISGGGLTVTSSNNSIATVSMNGNDFVVQSGTSVGNATITVKSAATTNYTEASAVYNVTVKDGTLHVTANGYSGIYDGAAHGISVSCSTAGATITYSTSQNGTYTTTNPTYTNVGTYTVWYKVEKPGYTTVTGSEKVVIEAKKLTGISVTKAPTTTSYIHGSAFNTSGMQVTATYNNGTTAVIPHKNYTILEYIESTGTQYIDTGYSAPSGFVIDAEFAYTEIAGSYIVGSHNISSPYGRNGVGLNGNGYWELGTGDSCPGASSVPSLNTKYTIKSSTVKGNSYIDINGTRVVSTGDSTSRSSDNLFVFYNQYSKYHGANTAKGRLYYLKIYDSSGKLVRDFVPCINPSGQVGLYDLVNDKFYANAGSGSFIAGPAALPSGYTPLKYIESTGTQYIDTEIAWNTNDLRVQGEYAYTEMMGHSSIFGTQGNSSNANLILREQSGTLTWWLGGNNSCSITTVSVGQKINFDLTTTASGSYSYNVSVNGGVAKTGSGTYSTIYDNNPIYLFDTYYEVTGKPASQTASTITCKAKLYSFKVWRGGALVRDFVPCKNQSGVVGLYDTVNDKFYTNSGTGSFVAGPEIGGNSSGYIITNGTLTAGQTSVTISYTEDGITKTTTQAVTVNNGTLTVTANGYTGTYDGKAHGITVICDGATITYSTSQNGTYSATNPTYTNVGTYTVYYKVTKSGYTTVTGNKTVKITKANNNLTLSATSGTLNYPSMGTFTITNNPSGGALSIAVSNSGVVIATLSGTTVTVIPMSKDGTATITVTSAATANYNAATATYTVTVKLKTLSSISVTKAPTTTSYLPGGNFNTSGMQVTATYNNGTTAIIPHGYTFLEYIEATGTQYINTGVTGHARWEFDIQFTNTTTRQLMGYGPNGDEYWGVQTNGGYGLFATTTIGTAGGRDKIVHDYVSGNAYLYAQNKSLYVGGNTNIPNQYQIFTIASMQEYCCKAKLYGCNVIQNGKVIREFVPAKNSAGVVGLYDMVNGKFYTNAGSGTFVAGPVVLPAGYTTLEYIQSSGTQYIDTGASIRASTWVDADLMFNSAFDYNMMFGAWSYFAVSLRAPNTVCAAGGGSQTQNVGSTTTTGVKYNIKVGADKGYTQDGVKYALGGSANVGSGRHILLFAASDGSTGDNPYAWTSYGVGRIYSFKIYEGNALVRDFVPCKNSSGTIGLYDLVEGKFYANKGTGSFTAGTVQNTSRSYNQYGYYITNGTNLPVGQTSVTISYTENGVTKTTTQAISVAKANGQVTLSSTSMTFTNPTDMGSKTFTVTTNKSGGALSASSSNTSVATVSVSGNTVTVTPKGVGTATITVTSAATSAYNAASATCSVTVSNKVSTITFMSNRMYGQAECNNVSSDGMVYSSFYGTIDVRAVRNDGYGFIQARAYLEAGKTYTFQCNHTGTWGSQAEAFLMLDGQYNKIYYMGSSNYTFTCDTTGTYWVRLDSNNNGETIRFWNLGVYENLGTKTVIYGQQYGNIFPTPSIPGHTFIGWFDGTTTSRQNSSITYKEAPMLYYADIWGDLYAAYYYDQGQLYRHYWSQGLPAEGRRASQYISTDTVYITKDTILYGRFCY